MRLDREQILAFRLNSHNLAQRRPVSDLLAVTGVCGVQNTPPGSAELSLHARLEGLEPGEIGRRLVDTKDLLQAWSLRASPYLFPTLDAAVFTLGVLPAGEADTRHFIYGVEALLDKIGIEAVEVVDRTAAALEDALAGRGLTKDELGIELAELIAPHLTEAQRAAWHSPSWVVAGQSLGESVVRFALPLTALRGICCHAERVGNKAYFRRSAEWLGKRSAQPQPETARAELARRYLHAYGPSTPESFAGWVGISASQAQATWRLIQGECVEVEVPGQQAWMLEEDAAGFDAVSLPEGVRLLQAHDPYVQMRDRKTLIPERSLHKHIWRTVGSPGLVLVDGEAAATWRSQKKSKRLVVSVETFAGLDSAQRLAVKAEANSIAEFRECTSLDVRWADFLID